MADFTCNIAKGRAIELYSRVDTNDPANSALIIVLLAATGLGTDDQLTDAATLAAILAVATEATNTGYARKTLTDSDLASLPAPDNALNQRTMAIPNQTWTNVQNDGTGDIAKLVVCYDPDVTSGTDANIVPLSHHDFPASPVGNNIETNFDALGFYRAAQTCP